MKKLAVMLMTVLLVCATAVSQTTGLKRVQDTRKAASVAQKLKERAAASAAARMTAMDEAALPVASAIAAQPASTSAASAHQASASAPKAPVQPPFICKFDVQKEFTDHWDMYDLDGDNKGWAYTTMQKINYPTADGNDESGFVYSRYNYSKAVDHHLVTKNPIHLSAGKAYVAFHHGIMEDYPERLRVYYGKTNSTKLSEKTLVGEVYDHDSLGWKFCVLSFNLQEEGDYYFSFVHCSDANQFYLMLDNIEIGTGTYVGTPNLTLLRPVLPLSTCNLGGSETIGVEIKNNGTAAIAQAKLQYSVEGKDNIKGELILSDTLHIGRSRTLYFDQKADLSALANYQFTIKGEVVKSTGKPEAVITDNEVDGHSTHFTPTSLPLRANFSQEAPDPEYFGFDPAYWDYWEDEKIFNAADASPLITRCVNLEAGKKYRVNLEYMAGVSISLGLDDLVIPEDFHLVYGPSDAPMSEWEVLEIYSNVYTKEAFVYDESVFEQKTSGLYAFAVVPKAGLRYGTYNGTLCLNRFEVEQVWNHDVKISKVYPSLGRLTPARHAVTPRFNVMVTNRGQENEKGVKVTAKLNNGASVEPTLIGVSANADIKSGKTESLSLSGTMPRPAAGSEVRLDFETDMAATDQYADDNKRQWTFTASDEVYAFDQDVEEYEDGIGFNAVPEFIFGPIFTLSEPDTLKAVSIGWLDLEDAIPFNVGIEIYAVDDTGKVGNCLLTTQIERQAEGGLHEHEIPARVLQAGRYFIAVRQLSDLNMAIGYDNNPEGVFYALAADETVVSPLVTHGYVAIRAVFGHAEKMVSKDIELLSVSRPGNRGGFTANEPIEITYRNNGKDKVSARVKCLVDAVEVGTKTVEVEAYAMGTVSFTGDLSRVGIHSVKAEAVAEGDENPDNNAVFKSVECVVIDPYIMDFELCDNFAITGLTPWDVYDGDKALTWGASGVTWPNANAAQSFIAFNPSETLPAIDNALPAHGGERYGAVFASINAANNDWLISPKLKLPATDAGMSCYVRSFKSSSSQYTEKFKVWVSETSNDITTMQEVGTYETSSGEWERQQINLSAYNGKEVYIGIQCVSNDQYIFMIDDIRVMKPAGVEKNNLAEVVKAYPNPVSEVWTVTAHGTEIERVEWFNAAGALVYRADVPASSDTWRLNVSRFKSGFYTARVYTKAGVQAVKVSIK